MPLKANAGTVREKYNAEANARVNTTVTARLSQLEQAEKFLVRALDAAVTGYFEAKHKAGAHPYPDQNRAIVSVLDKAFVSGNDPDAQRAISTLDPRQVELITGRLYQELTDAGFQAQLAFDAAKGSLVVTLTDPRFRPIDIGSEKQRRFGDALGRV